MPVNGVLLASCPGLRTLGFTPPEPGLLPPALPCPPDSARPGSPPVSSLTFQFSVVQELLIGHCRERRGRGRGLSQGGKEAGRGPSGAGLDSWCSLPRSPFPAGARWDEWQSRAFPLLLQTPERSGCLGSLRPILRVKDFQSKTPPVP